MSGLMFNLVKRTAYIICQWVMEIMIIALPFNFLRINLLRLAGAKIGRRTFIARGVRVDFPWRLEIGENVFISRLVYLDCRGGRISIGSAADISEGCKIYTLSHDIRSRGFDSKQADVDVGDRAWLCTGSILLPGARIAKGVVIGANTVCASHTEEFSLYVGNVFEKVTDLPEDRASLTRE